MADAEVSSNTHLIMDEIMSKVRTLRGFDAYSTILARLGDLSVLLGTAWGAYFIRQDVWDLPANYLALVFGGCLLASIILSSMGVYQSWRGQLRTKLIARLLNAWLVVWAIIVGVLFFTKSSELYSRAWLFSWFFLSFSGAVLLRAAFYPVINRVRKSGRNRKQVILVGDSHSCQTAIDHVNKEPWNGFDIAAIYLTDTAQELSDVPDVQVFETIDGLDAQVLDVHEIWICLPLSQGDEVYKALDKLRYQTANIRYIPTLKDILLINHSVSEVAGLFTLDLSCSPISGFSRYVKAFEDKIIASIILLLASPLMLFLAIGVKLSSPGPVFYRQERVSWNGKPFDMLKFRSMPVDVEKNGVQWGGAQNKTVTPFGQFIRKTSLDELPQFINVLKGDMSIVGPRPERTIFVEQFKHEIPGYMQKHMVKAGITGWAQINGWRGDTDLKKRIECDLYYIENWSLWLDVKIIFLTVFKGFLNKNAY